MRQRVALIMAAGTGGHIFPGLAVAEALRAQGWSVHWLGTPTGMENRLVRPKGFVVEPIEFGGVRGKGWWTLPFLPLRLLRAFWQARVAVLKLNPDVVVGFGGYVTFPGGLMSVWLNRPLILHEQNSVAGMANRWLASIADRVFTAFPNALPKGEWIGNPLRADFLRQPAPAQRWAGRQGPLRLLVVGGSLGAQALNQIVPKALSMMSAEERPVVTHQSGESQIAALKANYEQAGVQANLVPFIQDMAQAMADADLVIARSGASTVTEVAAIGVAAWFVPFPHAVDDHQKHNAEFLSQAGGAWMTVQNEFTPEKLLDVLRNTRRPVLQAMAQQAQLKAQTQAVSAIVDACEALAQRNIP
jgi:UDP-N-acetylglucosamine--N-acetylmuramyl-(pentapeptide) pyrophosphoryl-undecaprenol N-acetylglucosamine transferase